MTRYPSNWKHDGILLKFYTKCRLLQNVSSSATMLVATMLVATMLIATASMICKDVIMLYPVLTR